MGVVSGSGKIPSVLAAIALLGTASCSKPVLQPSPAPAPLQTTAGECDPSDLSNASWSASTLRTLIHCLNTNQELAGVEKLAQGLPDSDLDVFARAFSQILNDHPRLLYALREEAGTTLDPATSRRLKLAWSAAFRDPKRTALFQTTFPDTLPWLFSSEGAGRGSSWATVGALLNAPSLKRFLRESLDSKALLNWLPAYQSYRGKPGALSLNEILELTGAGPLLNSNDPESLQRLSRFFDGVTSTNDFTAVSQGAQSLSSSPLVCFGQRRSLHPYPELISQLKSLSGTGAALYLKDEIQSLALAAKGFCTFPGAVTPALHALQSISAREGFPEFFSSLRSHLSESAAKHLLTSPDFRTLIRESAPLAGIPFFQDALQVGSLMQQGFGGGVFPAPKLDELLSRIRPSDFSTLSSWARALVGEEQSPFSTLAKDLGQLILSLPEVPVPSPGEREAIARARLHLLQSPLLPEALASLSSVVEAGRIAALLDSFFARFPSALSRGAYAFVWKSAPKPATDAFWSRTFEKATGPGSGSSPGSDPCQSLSLDWNFNEYPSGQVSSYFSELDMLSRCSRPGSTYSAFARFARVSEKKGVLDDFLRIEKAVLDRVLSVHFPLATRTLGDLFDLSRSDSERLKGFLLRGSEVLSRIRAPLFQSAPIREWLASLVRDPGTWKLPEMHFDPWKPSVTGIPVPDDRGETARLFHEYCPELDPSGRHCRIDEDQVLLYRNSPEGFQNLLWNEYLNSRQTWLHPKGGSWTHRPKGGERVSDLEFHLYPALHLLRQSPQAMDGAFSGLRRFQKDRIDLSEFLETRAKRLRVIPYYYQRGDYAGGKPPRFHDRIRIRWVNDLDRLELLAINADFKAFGVIPNFGMKLIRILSLSWGDVPPMERPESLRAILGSEEPLSFKQFQKLVELELKAFDNPIVNHFPGVSELKDIRARVFNLKLLVPVLAENLPLLRDLFYGLTESNPAVARGRFFDGDRIPAPCLLSPLPSGAPPTPCLRDHLTLIPRFAELGILHLAGRSVLEGPSSLALPLSTLLEQATTDRSIQTLAREIARSDRGSAWILNGVASGFGPDTGIPSGFARAFRLLRFSRDLKWVNLSLEGALSHPTFPYADAAWLNPILGTLPGPPSRESQASFSNWLDRTLKGLTPETRSSLLSALPVSSDNRSTLGSAFRDFNHSELPRALQADLSSWTHTLSTEEGAKDRGSLADWVSSPDFTSHCAIASDPSWIASLGNLIESIQQNPDTPNWIRRCRSFLNTR